MMRVLYLQYTNPGAYPPLVRGARLLAESGAEVCMLGTRVPGLDALDVQPTPDVCVKLTEAAADGWRLKAHYARYAAWVTRESASWRPDWIYASDLLSAPVALAVAAVTGARVVYHEHDAPSLAHESWTIKRCLDARRRLLRQADIVITPNADRSTGLSQIAGGRPVLTVWNCPRRPHQELRKARDWSGPRVIFRGSINADRLPVTVAEALARAPDDVHLDIAGYETVGSRGHVAELLSTAARLGVGDRIRFLGTVPNETLAEICQQSDLGLALMPVGSLDENMRHMTGASNKVFEYLSDGVIPLVSDLPDWRAMFVDPGYALACDPRDPDSIASAFSWSAHHRDEMRAMALRAWERLQSDWSYEAQFAPVLRAMWGAGNGHTGETVTTSSAHAEAPCAS
jgi:glycosyltransferase involved in cell wall biosynthesis